MHRRHYNMVMRGSNWYPTNFIFLSEDCSQVSIDLIQLNYIVYYCVYCIYNYICILSDIIQDAAGMMYFLFVISELSLIDDYSIKFLIFIFEY